MNMNRTAIGHSLSSIDDNIGDDLLNLSFINRRCPEVFHAGKIQLHIATGEIELRHLAHEGLEIHVGILLRITPF